MAQIFLVEFFHIFMSLLNFHQILYALEFSTTLILRCIIDLLISKTFCTTRQKRYVKKLHWKKASTL